MTTAAVVVLNWNGSDDTIACVRSLQAMARTPDAIVVVDNASTDGSEERLRASCPGVEVLQSGANLGFAGGNNVGIRRALALGADLVWLLNNDATAHRDALGELLAEADRDPRVGMVGSRIYVMQRPEQLQCWGGGWANPWTGRSSEFDHPVPVGRLDYITGCSLLLRRGALETAGLLDEGFFMYFEDTELGYRYRRAGWKLGVADRALVFHKGGATANLSPRQSAWRTQSLLRFLKLQSRSYRVSASLSTMLRGASFALRRNWVEVGRLCQNVIRFAREPDWRHRAP